MQKNKTYLRDHGHAPFKFGEGRISGYICAALGLLSLLAVLCFLLPEWLTTTELRKVYNEQLARSLLLLGLALLISAAVFIPLEKLYAKNAVPWLWRFHAVHHSSTAMDWLTGSRVHFVEVLLTCTAVLMRRPGDAGSCQCVHQRWLAGIRIGTSTLPPLAPCPSSRLPLQKLCDSPAADR